MYCALKDNAPDYECTPAELACAILHFVRENKLIKVMSEISAGEHPLSTLRLKIVGTFTPSADGGGTPQA